MSQLRRCCQTLPQRQSGKIKEEMLGLVPTLRGQVSGLRVIPVEHHKEVAAYNFSVANFKSLGHAACRSHGAGSLGVSLNDCCNKRVPNMHAACQFIGSWNKKRPRLPSDSVGPRVCHSQLNDDMLLSHEVNFQVTMTLITRSVNSLYTRRGLAQRARVGGPWSRHRAASKKTTPRRHISSR